jgi:hypothetical protein
MAVAAETSTRPLDDVMIAMDVVDTLRHDKRIVERELNDERRRAELIDRLREIYRGQGMDVPDSILEEGVRALEEKRFAYTPPPRTLEVRLAEIYVTRERWGRTLVRGVLAAAVAVGGWYLLVERPRSVEQAAVERELRSELPTRAEALAGEIQRVARVPSVAEDARRVADAVKTAAASGNRDAARTGVRQLEQTAVELGRAFEVRIVNRSGEITGLWRVPRVNPAGRNYYLVVEAIDRSGRVVPREILNEETGKRETVSKWAVRVPKAVFDQIQADKLDDGIIQRAVIGTKAPGDLEPVWRLEVAGGALTSW